jgi:hypothetical protein
MYSFNIVEGGIAYTVYFFAAFSGHFQPFTPVEPLEFDDIHSTLTQYKSSPYVQGWYTETANGPRLERLVKYWLMKTDFEGNFDITTTPGIYYRRLEKVDGKWQASAIIEPEVVLKQDHYLRYVINDEGKLESKWHVYSMVLDTYKYSYNPNGTLKSADISGADIPDTIPDL